MPAIKLCISGGATSGKTTALTQYLHFSASNDERCLVVVDTRELAGICKRFMSPETLSTTDVVGFSDALMMAGIKSLHEKFDAVFIDVRDPSELIHIIDERLKAYRPDVKFRVVFTKSTDDPDE